MGRIARLFGTIFQPAHSRMTLSDDSSPPLQPAPLLVDESMQAVDPRQSDMAAMKTEAPAIEETEIDDEDGEDTTRSREQELAGPAWRGVILALLPILVCFLGAGRETWSKGVAAILMAIWMFIFPPRRRLPLWASLCLLSLIIVPLLAFMPASWHGAAPIWRTRLTQDWGVNLSETLTPQAWVTLESWCLMTLSVLWLLWCLTRGFSSDERRSMLQTVAAGGLLVCVLSLLEYFKLISIPWWPRRPEWGDVYFGPFANRNHGSSLAALVCILCAALAFDAQRRKSRAWAAFALGALVPLACIFVNTSRAGVLLLFLGMTVWLGTSAMGRGFFQKVMITISLMCIIATLLVLSGGGVATRFAEQRSGEGGTVVEGRYVIYSHTLNLSQENPWMGIGLGNFDTVFQQFLPIIYNQREMYIHPESDVLWLLAEGGLLCVLPALLMGVWFLSVTGPWFRSRRKERGRRQDRRLRNSAAIACGIGLVHGLFDVPNHGLGYFSLIALLAGIAVRPRRLPVSAGSGTKLLNWAGGSAALFLGVCWFAIANGRPWLPGASASEMLHKRATAFAASGSAAAALPLYNAAIEMKPMNFLLYYDRASILLSLGRPAEAALEDFSRSRALNPNYTDLCYREGLFWLNHRPEFAIIPWREILLRWPGYYYSTLLSKAEPFPELEAALWDLANTNELKIIQLNWIANRAEFEQFFRKLVQNQPDLEGLTPHQREQVFTVWYRYGDQTALISALETNRKWRDDGWRILAEHYARNSDFQKACQTVVPYLPSIIRTAPGTSSDIPALERALLYNPTDARRGIDLFQAQKNQGDITGALRTLEKVAAIPNAPPYVQQEIAALYVMQQDFRRAWEHLREAMQKR